jgi:hypothetical protein
LTLIPVIVVPANAKVPVIVVLPKLAEEILLEANVFAPVNILLLARYAKLEVPTKLFTLSPVIVPPLSDSVPVTVRLPTFAEAILELANVFAPEKIFVFARYAIEEVPESWLIEIPDTVPVTFRLPTFAEAMLELAKVLAPVKTLLFAKYASEDVPEIWLIESPVTPPATERVPVTFRLPTFADAILLEAKVLAPVKMFEFAKYARLEVPDKLLIARPEMLAPVKFADEVTERLPTTALVAVTFVNTPVLGVVAPIGVLLITPPVIVSASAMLLSPNEPVIEPNEPSASVTPAFPSVPESIAVAETCPVASTVRPFATMASVMLFAGKETVPVTANCPMLAATIFAEPMLEEEIVEVRNEVVAVNVFCPVNVLLPLSVTMPAPAQPVQEFTIKLSITACVIVVLGTISVPLLARTGIWLPVGF